MSRVCVISPFTGLAGDMLLAALVDAGAPLDAIRAAVAETGLTGWDLTVTRVLTHGITGSRAEVAVSDDATSRKAAELIAMASRVRARPVADVAVAALKAIAEVEGRLHGEDPDEVHLHELGGHDTLVDIVGVAAALHALDIRTVHCEPLPLGTGTVRTAHGVLPCPAPATAALLEGAVVTGTSLTGETVTPTAAALLRALSANYGQAPVMRLTATGYGAGTRILSDRPNVAVVRLGEVETAHVRGHLGKADTAGGRDRVVVGTADVREPHGEADTAEVRDRVVPATADGPDPGDAANVRDLVVLETNLDDVTGEVLGHVVGHLLDHGALDSWITPAVMKKGRPAHVLHALTTPESADDVERLILAETGTLGVRRTAVRRTAAARATDTVYVEGLPVRRKHGPHHSKPEFDDAVAVARQTGLPLRTVLARANPLGER